MFDIFDCVSPAEYRYRQPDVSEHLSENSFIRAKIKVERALLKVLSDRKICPESVVEEFDEICNGVDTAEVYAEERRIGHDIRALVNCLGKRMSPEARRYVHLTATSYDIVDTTNAVRYRDAITQTLVPALIELLRVIIALVLREAETIQIGRTHGQHAVPITLGFALAEYVSRLGNSIKELKRLAKQLVGKFSGAVGAYNASALLFDDPQSFEADILAELGLLPAEHSTQIVPPEAMTRLFCEVTITTGVMANLADDMRNLQRSEIAEVSEKPKEKQVGSSTMPHKRNPIAFENAKSCWKVVMPRLMTVFLDQISEHQRDLTNSASGRTYGETIVYATSIAKRLTKAMNRLQVDYENLARNIHLNKGAVGAEPLYIILAHLGHPDAHEKVRMITNQAYTEKRPLQEVAQNDPELADYFIQMTARQREILSSPSHYTGIAAKVAVRVADHWRSQLD